MHIKNLNLWIIHDFKKIIKILTIVNIFTIFELVIFEKNSSIIVYLDWLQKLSLQKQKNFILMMKFIFSKIVNALINQSLMWEKKIHVCKQLFCNHNFKQCYNCWAYKHVENQCLIVIKCRQCEKTRHEKRICQIFTTCFKCEMCEEIHHVQHKNCKARVRETKKLKLMNVNIFFFFFAWRSFKKCDKSLIINFETRFSFNNIKKKKNYLVVVQTTLRTQSTSVLIFIVNTFQKAIFLIIKSL